MKMTTQCHKQKKIWDKQLYRLNCTQVLREYECAVIKYKATHFCFFIKPFQTFDAIHILCTQLDSHCVYKG